MWAWIGNGAGKSGARRLVRDFWFAAAAERKLADRALDVEIDPGDLLEQIDAVGRNNAVKCRKIRILIRVRGPYCRNAFESVYIGRDKRCFFFFDLQENIYGIHYSFVM